MAKPLKEYIEEHAPQLGFDAVAAFERATKQLSRYGEDTADKAMVFDGVFEIETKEVDDDEPVVDITVEIADRSKEVLLVSGADFKNFEKNPIMLSGHRYAPEFTIGGSRWINRAKGQWGGKEVNVLRAKPWFASTPFAQDHKVLVKEGALRAFSHTFIPIAFVDDEESIKELGFNPRDIRRVYTKWELLEISLVTIPDNPAALIAQKGAIESVYFKDMIKRYETEGKEEKEEEPEEEFELTLRDLLEAIDSVKSELEEVKELISKGKIGQEPPAGDSGDLPNEKEMGKLILETVNEVVKEKIEKFKQEVN